MQYLLNFSNQRHAVTLRLSKVCVLNLRSLLIAPFLIIDDIISKKVSVLQSMHQSREAVNDVMNHHHFLRGNSRTNFNYIPCLELEILERGCTFLPFLLKPLSLSYLSAHKALEKIRKTKLHKISQFWLNLHIADTSIEDAFVQTGRCPLFRGFTVT